MAEWFSANWLGILGVLLTIFFGFAGASYIKRKSYRPKITSNKNTGKGDQYNAGRDININKEDRD